MHKGLVKEYTAEIPLVPPGFASLTSFTLKRVYDDVIMSCTEGTGASDSRQTQMESECSVYEDAKLTRSLRRRPWINYSKFDNSSEDESDSEQFNQDSSSICRLPKGVISGCVECSNCQKVIARWRPEDACRPILDEAPVFYPNDEEFKDTLKYIASIRKTAEPHGICRIVPPPSWKPPCPLKENTAWKESRFATRIQQVNKLQNRSSMKTTSRYYYNMKRKKRRCLRMGFECRTNGNGDVAEANELGSPSERFGFEPGPQFTLEAFQKYADDFKEQYFGMKESEQGSGFSQDKLQKHDPPIENIEGEYWRMVEKPTEEVEVLYGADIETKEFGSGFCRASEPQGVNNPLGEYEKSGWNLNNFSRLPGSVLSFESGDISGVLVPWLYVGMCFSSFCWHVEDHHLYSMNYMHWGAPKMWYGVAGKDALKLEAAMKKHLPDLFDEQPDLLHKLVTQLSPSILKSEGVPVYRCVQHPGEFVLTFPRAYHSGFNCGFNCAEAVNVAPVDWLPHGQSAVELYREQGRKTSVSHDKLLLGAAREAVRAHWELQLLRKNTVDNLRWKDVCGKDGILTKALKTRVEMERLRREYLCNPSQSRKMDSSFDETYERECVICLYDLHLSAAGCQCSPDKFSCLNHAKQLCSCAWSTRYFLFRYDISELNILVEALGGKLSAIYRWAHLDLGLSLSSFVAKDKSQEPKSSVEEIKLKHGSPNGVNSTGSVQSARVHRETNASAPQLTNPEDSKQITQAMLDVVNVTSTVADPSVQVNPLSLNEMLGSKGPCLQHTSSHETKVEDRSFKFREGYIPSDPNLLGMRACQLSQKDLSCTEPSETTSGDHISLGCEKLIPAISRPLSNSNTTECKANQISLSGDGNVILLSDDEGEDTHVGLPDSRKKESHGKHLEAPLRLMDPNRKVASCNSQKDRVLNTPETNASVMSEGDANLLPVLETVDYFSKSVSVKVEDHGKDGTYTGNNLVPSDAFTKSFSQNLSRNIDSVTVPCGKNIQDLREPGDSNTENAGSRFHRPTLYGSGKPQSQDKLGNPGLSSGSKLLRGIPISGNLYSSPNNVDRCHGQKGPRVAKVVRRINCSAELLEIGVISSRKLWSNSHAIFPKGFKSRARYFSVVDPTKMCYYVSQILDAGLPGPLFMVVVEQYPSEVFIHLSAAKSWDMVRERVNDEIRKQHGLGKVSLPPLQPPGSIDGLDMFGFSSPAIIQALEAMDCNRICSEYWKSKPEPSNPQPALPGNLVADLQQMIEEPND